MYVSLVKISIVDVLVTKKANNVLESKKIPIFTAHAVLSTSDIGMFNFIFYLVSDGSPTAGSGGNPSQCETRTLPVSCQPHAQQGLRAGAAAASAASAAAPAGSSAASQLRASALPFGHQPLGDPNPHTHTHTEFNPPDRILLAGLEIGLHKSCS